MELINWYLWWWRERNLEEGWIPQPRCWNRVQSQGVPPSQCSMHTYLVLWRCGIENHRVAELRVLHWVRAFELKVMHIRNFQSYNHKTLMHLRILNRTPPKALHNSKFSLIHFLDSKSGTLTRHFCTWEFSIACIQKFSHSSKLSLSLSLTPPILSIGHLTALTRMFPKTLTLHHILARTPPKLSVLP